MICEIQMVKHLRICLILSLKSAMNPSELKPTYASPDAKDLVLKNYIYAGKYRRKHFQGLNPESS